jgi:hypothetical protein
MGKYFIDKYSTYHLCSGIIAYYCGLSFAKWFILHAIYEMVENSRLQKELDKIEIWPGRKPKPDTIINSIGDQICAILGWCIGYVMNKYK